MKNNSVCCIIVTYNIGDRFYKCFNSIKDQVEYVVIVDNGSNEQTISVLKEIEKSDRVQVIYNNTNEGIAKALNKAVNFAENRNYKFVLTMDNDSIATPYMVDSLIATYELATKKDNMVVSVFPKYEEMGYYDSDLEQISSNDNIKYSYIDCEMTSGNLINIKVFKKIGYYNEEYFIDYVDHEFCLRLLSDGYNSIRAESAILLHSLGKSQKIKLFGKEIVFTNHNSLRRYYITRNRFDVWKRHSEFDFVKRDKRHFCKEFVKMILFENDKINKVMSIIYGIKDYKKQKFGKLNKNNK